ncbi:MAG TPA: hypothetical protein VHD36_04905 [Pirellulales bacterium]|nr:hypothetical protein [Pirellulales bacterium]
MGSADPLTRWRRKFEPWALVISGVEVCIVPVPLVLLLPQL